MSRRDTYFYIMMLSGVFSITYAVWITPINLKPEYIPEILSGITACISIMIGFVPTVLAIVFKKGSGISPKEFDIAIALLAIPIVLLLLMYYYLVIGVSLENALRFAVTNLAVSFGIFFSIIKVFVQKNI